MGRGRKRHCSSSRNLNCYFLLLFPKTFFPEWAAMHLKVCSKNQKSFWQLLLSPIIGFPEVFSVARSDTTQNNFSVYTINPTNSWESKTSDLLTTARVGHTLSWPYFKSCHVPELQHIQISISTTANLICYLFVSRYIDTQTLSINHHFSLQFYLFIQLRTYGSWSS